MVKWLGLVVALLGPGLAPPALAGVQVQVDDGRISAVLEDAPVPDALAALKRAGGPEIVLPEAARSRSLTLTVERVRLEEFVRRLLQALDLGGFALVYEADGAAGRVVVVDRSRGGPPPAEPPAEASAGVAAEPVYIPPASPPVYIPPASPPVYIPPASPPVYIPPASPPVYVPPATDPQPAPTQ
jgi:hypothetical protein